MSCPSDVYEHQGKYYLPVIPSSNISRANGGQGKLKGTTIWDGVRIIQRDDGPYLGKESIFHLTWQQKQALVPSATYIPFKDVTDFTYTKSEGAQASFKYVFLYS